MGPPDPDPPPTSSLVYGASFVAMTEPDTRLAFREGAFVESGFYPRHGCPGPLPAFSLLSAGGFSFADAIAATAAGTLPSEDPTTCVQTAPEAATVAIPLRAPAEVREVRCEQRREDSSVRYRRPPIDSPELVNHPYACASIPNLGGDPIAPPGTIQLVAASASDEQCRGITHYTLLGCDDRSTLVCDTPEWDYQRDGFDEPPAPTTATASPRWRSLPTDQRHQARADYDIKREPLHMGTLTPGSHTTFATRVIATDLGCLPAAC